ncbi:hypothetical protein BH11VER1_BH11VER1_12260 [soil metagenome]
MNRSLLSILFCFQVSIAFAVDFKKDIAPILKAQCYKCHSEEAKKEKAGYVFDNLERLGKDIGPGRVIEPGDIEESHLYQVLIKPQDDDGHMPPNKALEAGDLAKIKQWITDGAPLEGGKKPTAGGGSSLGAPGSLPARPVMQSWTSADGRVIQAAMLRVEGETVILQMANGQTYPVPLSKLSAASQELAKRGGK